LRSRRWGLVVFVVVGSITGNVRVKSCCGIADQRCDTTPARAFLDAANTTKPSRPADGGYAG
jgi:hypothetical protein